MSFRTNLVRARGHIVFLVALVLGLCLVLWLERLGQMPVADTTADEQQIQIAPNAEWEQDLMATFENVDPLPLDIRGLSSVKDLDDAKIAWKYFQNNTDPVTGLVNSANNYPSTTMWETGSYLIAVLAAERLGLIDASEAESRIGKVLDSLKKIRLFDDMLPNKAYNTRTLELVDYTNKPSAKGLGWSALDIARIIASFGLVERNHPDLAPKVEDVMDGWKLSEMVKDGELWGANVREGKTVENQEGRVGYEQYAAKAMMLFGYDMYRAYEVRDNLMIKEVDGEPIPVDSRMHRGVTPAFVVSEPYLFDGLEFGFDARSQRFATAVYKAQEARYERTGQLTAVTESHLNVAPYFAYATVWGGGAPWAVLSFAGDRMDSKRTLATKAAYAWNALFGTDYTRKLVAGVASTADPEKGFAEGIYETDGTLNTSITANTNSVVLSSLAFKLDGPLMRAVK
ncbi:DUF3131 domain-containing protein [Pseudooceanicola sp. CBS1P-1]|uniref:DUF3131 domain-containing protein n=1 Tax=Pseudooceanicola albus TaxID=2692189 RepID=A0A6L7G4C0_9RHOB|nr:MULTISPECIES: DUF3131 domain-containing protein [Pseudooceanicola]MBT9383026.1 DUF3131 domain-containing protein [Pseudooceanicola endophyticus]MXN19214.1 DUF3131 domain-containing protein [Pseudooceanicola albus]